MRLFFSLFLNVSNFILGSHAGTPLHHAAKRGLDHTVKLLLLHGGKYQGSRLCLGDLSKSSVWNVSDVT